MAHSQKETQRENCNEADGKTLSDISSQKLTHGCFSRTLDGGCDLGRFAARADESGQLIHPFSRLRRDFEDAHSRTYVLDIVMRDASRMPPAQRDPFW